MKVKTLTLIILGIVLVLLNIFAWYLWEEILLENLVIAFDVIAIIVLSIILISYLFDNWNKKIF